MAPEASKMTIDRRWVTSMHECAHAIASLELEEPVYRLVARDDGTGEFQSHPPRFNIPLARQQHVLQVVCDDWKKDGGPADREWLERKIIGLLAGPQATIRLLHRTRGCGHDFLYVDMLNSTLPDEQQRHDIYASCEERARHIVWQRWADISRLAERLYREGELFEPAIRDTLWHSGPRGRISIAEAIT
jgi:hypothetical protein